MLRISFFFYFLFCLLYKVYDGMKEEFLIRRNIKCLYMYIQFVYICNVNNVNGICMYVILMDVYVFCSKYFSKFIQK